MERQINSKEELKMVTNQLKAWEVLKMDGELCDGLDSEISVLLKKEVVVSDFYCPNCGRKKVWTTQTKSGNCAEFNFYCVKCESRLIIVTD